MSVKFTTLKFKGAKICEAFSLSLSLLLVSICANFAWGLDIDGTITQDINKKSLVNKHQVNVAELH